MMWPTVSASSADLAAAPADSVGGATSIAARRTSRPSSSTSVRPSMTDATVPLATVVNLHSLLGTGLGGGGFLPAAGACACAAVAALNAAAMTPTRNALPMPNKTPAPFHHATRSEEHRS